MMREIILHDLLSNLKSARFIMGFLVAIVLFILSGVLAAGDARQAASDSFEQERMHDQWMRENSSQLARLAIGRQKVFCPPSPLQFVSSGSDRLLPNSALVSAFGMWKAEAVTRANPLLRSRDALGWAFIVSVVLSFMAFSMTFDAFTGEKESGTLRLVLSSGIPRRRLVLGKIAGAVLILSLPLVAGTLVALLVLSAAGTPIPGAGELARLAMIVLCSLLYLSLFAAIGTLISSVVHRSAVSLVLCLIVWVVLVLIIPNLGGLLAQRFSPIDAEKTVQAAADRAREEAWAAAPGRVWSCFGSDYNQPCFKERADMQLRIVDDQMKIRDNYRLRQLHQADIARRWANFSPTALYRDLVSRAANAGVSRWIDFSQRVTEYRQGLLEFVFLKDRLDDRSPHLINPEEGFLFSTKPVAAGEIPRFRYREPDAAELIGRTIGDAGVLALLNVLLVMAAVVAFNRYDVR